MAIMKQHGFHTDGRESTDLILGWYGAWDPLDVQRLILFGSGASLKHVFCLSFPISLCLDQG
jgi:hypothetical protein